MALPRHQHPFLSLTDDDSTFTWKVSLIAFKPHYHTRQPPFVLLSLLCRFVYVCFINTEQEADQLSNEPEESVFTNTRLDDWANSGPVLPVLVPHLIVRV